MIMYRSRNSAKLTSNKPQPDNATLRMISATANRHPSELSEGRVNQVPGLINLSEVPPRIQLHSICILLVSGWWLLSHGG